MDKNLTKKKIELMKSVMSDPKLSKQFREAMGAPIGSTKREQAKSIFSIMKKVGGVRNDGMGGPISGYSGISGIQQPSPTLNTSTNYGNMMIFPAAPALKNFSDVKLSSLTKPKDGGLTGTKNQSIFPSVQNINTTLSSPSTSWNTLSNTLSKDINKGNVSTQSTSPVAQFSNLKLPTPSTVKTAVPGLTGAYTETPDPFWTAFETANRVNTLQNKRITETPVSTTSTVTDTTKKQPDTTTSTPTTPISGTSTTVGGGNQAPLSEGDKIKASAQQAVKEGTGSGLFAMGIADEKFGGGLDAYINKLDEKLKTDFNLEPLETELSNLKAQKNNLVPTLQQYIQGKDQYLKFIDQMIEQTEDTLLKQDMGNPAVANSYNNYLTYLYTLKGRQNQRYGNFLNAAISDYNADLEKTQSNYENVYNQYNNALTRQGTIAQNEYNTLYTTMANLYTSLEEAPVKRANLEALQLQNEANRLIIAQNKLDQANLTNPDYLKDVKTYIEHISDKDGNLSMEVLGAGGLIGFFGEISYQGGDPQAAAKAVNTSMATSLLNSTGEEKIKKVQEYKKLVDNLASVEGGNTLASMITPTLNSNSLPIVSEYVLNNLGDIKSATDQLVNKSFWGRKTGLSDKEGWLEKNKNLDTGVLNNLYDLTNNAVSSGTYASNPSKFVSDWFSGNDDKTIADRVASDLVSTW